MRETAIYKQKHGTHPLLGNGEEGKHSMSQERGSSLASRASRDEFGKAAVNFGPPNPATELIRRPYGVKGSVLSHSLPSFWCLEDGPDAAERRPGSGFPTGRGTGDGHLEAHHDLQARPARPGKATRLGVRGSIVPAAPRNFIFIIYFKMRGEGISFLQRKKTEQQ